MVCATLLPKNGEALVKVGRETDPCLKPTTDLRNASQTVLFHDLAECRRRILLYGVVVFIYVNRAYQVAVTIIIPEMFWLHF